MIDRAGQLWEYRPGDTFEWRAVVILRSDWGPNVADYVGAQIFHVAMYVKEMIRTDLIENLEPGHLRWDENPENFRRLA